MLEAAPELLIQGSHVFMTGGSIANSWLKDEIRVDDNVRPSEQLSVMPQNRKFIAVASTTVPDSGYPKHLCQDVSS